MKIITKITLSVFGVLLIRAIYDGFIERKAILNLDLKEEEREDIDELLGMLKGLNTGIVFGVVMIILLFICFILDW